MSVFVFRKIGLFCVMAWLSMALSACGPRVIVSTGTTIGLKATPGDGSTRPPQVTFGYKRTELALVPTGENKATSNSDAFSTLASFNFYTKWFGKTQIHSFLGTGIAAREVQGLTEASPIANKALDESQKNGASNFWKSFATDIKAPAIK